MHATTIPPFFGPIEHKKMLKWSRNKSVLLMTYAEKVNDYLTLSLLQVPYGALGFIIMAPWDSSIEKNNMRDCL